MPEHYAQGDSVHGKQVACLNLAMIETIRPAAGHGESTPDS